MISAVIFDIDGTIVDSVNLHAKAWQVAFAEFGKDVSVAAIRKEIGKGADQLLPVFFSKEELNRFGRELDKYRGELFKREYLPQVKVFPKVRDLLRRIKEDEKLIALAFGVLCGGWTANQLQQSGCIAIYRDPAELLKCYDGSPISCK